MKYHIETESEVFTPIKVYIELESPDEAKFFLKLLSAPDEAGWLVGDKGWHDLSESIRKELGRQGIASGDIDEH